MNSERKTSSRGRRRALSAVVLGATVLLSFAGADRAAADERKFRACADPDNLPFSSEAGAVPGLYVESAALIANELGQSFEPVWSRTYFGKRSVRTTLLTGSCDAYLGLPASGEFMGQRVIVSDPLFEVSYAVAAPRSLQLRSLDDLSGKRVAVQFGSSPQSLLAERSDVTLLTVREPEGAMRALAEKRADAAFVWAPIAGFMNHTALGDAYQITPITGPGMSWKVAIGFARSSQSLRDRAIKQSREYMANSQHCQRNMADQPSRQSPWLRQPILHLASCL